MVKVENSRPVNPTDVISSVSVGIREIKATLKHLWDYLNVLMQCISGVIQGLNTG